MSLNFTVRLDEQTRMSLISAAESSGVSEADLVRLCIKLHLPLVDAWLQDKPTARHVSISLAPLPPITPGL